MSDELKVGDWVIRKCNEYSARRIVAGGDFEDGTIGLEYLQSYIQFYRPATPQEIAAAPGQPKEEGTEIEVGDTVELMNSNNQWDGETGIVKKVNLIDGVVYSYDTSHEYRWCWRAEKCRLVSKGKSGQGEGTLPKEPVKLDDPVKRTGAPCPACAGSIHGPGRIADWNDKPIACPRCQYGKPKPEAVIARPYHKILPSGECVLRTSVESHWNAVIECDKCGQSVIHSWRVQEGGKIFCNDCDEERQEDEKDAARAALEKAQAEARRLGILK